MPFFSFIYFVFILSNFGFPGTINFVGEFLISIGGFTLSNVFIFFSAFGLLLSAIYSLFFFNKIFFGIFPKTLRYYSDCTRLEFYVLFILFILILVLGLFPNLIFSVSLVSLKKLIFFFFT
jgi:NADH-quinone oxidoreductase subunit M